MRAHLKKYYFLTDGKYLLTNNIFSVIISSSCRKAMTETSKQKSFHSESHRLVKDGMKAFVEYIPELRFRNFCRLRRVRPLKRLSL